MSSREALDGGLPVLELHAASVRFGDRPGLVDLSLTIAPGERFVLVGPSGVGKSTLLRAIAGSEPLAGGEILVDGRSASPGEGPAERSMVLLEQRPLLFPHMSVLENVRFPLDARGVRRREATDRALEALERVHLAGLEDRRPGSLSGGQAHRVALARAVVSRPRILLLDEPLAALDPSLREEMRRTIVEIGAVYGSTLLFVTHDLQEAGRMGARIGVLLEGRLVQVGTPAEVFRAPGSESVARFIGWPNHLRVRIGEGPTRRRAVVSFGVDGAELRGIDDGAGLPVVVRAARHHPGGVSVEVRAASGALEVPGVGVVRADAARVGREAEDDVGAEGCVGDMGGVEEERTTGTAAVWSGEVAVDLDATPAVGARLRLVLRPGRFRVYPAAPTQGCDGGITDGATRNRGTDADR